MKINLTQPIVNLEGVAMKDSRVPNKDAMMNEIVANLIATAKPKEAKSAVKEMLLAQKLFQAAEPIELAPEDVVFLKAIVEASDLTTLVQGRIRQALEEEVK